MPEMATVLVQRSDAANSREWATPTHTLASPFVVKQRRVTPATPTARATDHVQITKGGLDSSGITTVIPAILRIEFTRQANLSASDISAILVLAREILSSSNYDAVAAGQSYLQ